MKALYIPDKELYRCHYLDEQTGGALSPVFRGLDIQEGYGIGNFLGSLFRTALPVLKSFAKPLLKSAGRELLTSGVKVMGNVAGGENIKSALKQRAKQGLQNVSADMIKTLAKTHSGKGYNFRKRKCVHKHREAPYFINGNKRLKTDIFD